MGKMKKGFRTLTRAGAKAPAVLGRLRHNAGGSAKKRGSAPGTVVYVGPDRDEPLHRSYIRYDGDDVREAGGPDEEGPSAETCAELLAGARGGDGTVWVNVDGVHHVGEVESLGHRLGLHRLVLEDIVHTAQRPKLEEYPEHLYLVVRMLEWDAGAGTLKDEQVSLVLGDGYVLSFQERPGDVFEPVRERIRTGRGIIRTRGADYLAYALLDAVVDHYFAVVEGVSDRIEELEMAIADAQDEALLHEVHRLKREMLLVRRAIWPLREVVSRLYRDEVPFIEEDTRIFLRDVYDHAIQVIDTVETLRDLLGGLMDLYMTGVSNRMNEVMKVLTIIATIFIPLSFLAGLYGMNFDVMPELHLSWGYPALLGVMALVAGGMLLFFRRRDWI